MAVVGVGGIFWDVADGDFVLMVVVSGTLLGGEVLLMVRS